MSELISGKEALIALANGQKVLIKRERWANWDDLTDDFTLEVFGLNEYQFRLKPRTVNLNGIEVPAPFEPKSMEDFYVIDGTHSQGWINGSPANPSLSMRSPKWRTEEEIKQVVVALRSVFNVK